MRWLVLLLVAIPALVAAQRNEASVAPVTISVRPVLCVIDGRTPHCDISFVVTWHSTRSGRYCLFNDFEALPLRCWAEEKFGELIDERVVETPFEYWITGRDGDEPLAAVTVEVLRVDDGDRRRRRRGRHVWDLL